MTVFYCSEMKYLSTPQRCVCMCVLYVVFVLSTQWLRWTDIQYMNSRFNHYKSPALGLIQSTGYSTELWSYRYLENILHFLHLFQWLKSLITRGKNKCFCVSEGENERKDPPSCFGTNRFGPREFSVGYQQREDNSRDGEGDRRDREAGSKLKYVERHIGVVAMDLQSRFNFLNLWDEPDDEGEEREGLMRELSANMGPSQWVNWCPVTGKCVCVFVCTNIVFLFLFVVSLGLSESVSYVPKQQCHVLVLFFFFIHTSSRRQ